MSGRETTPKSKWATMLRAWVPTIGWIVGVAALEWVASGLMGKDPDTTNVAGVLAIIAILRTYTEASR